MDGNDGAEEVPFDKFRTYMWMTFDPGGGVMVDNVVKKPIPAHELKLNLWRDNAIYPSKMHTRFHFMLFELVQRGRTHEVLNCDLMRYTTEMLTDLSHDLYQEEMEVLFIELYSGLQNILPLLSWIFYYNIIGVSTFILMVEVKVASSILSKVLERISGRNVIYGINELEDKQAKSRIWNRTLLSTFFCKPCNYELVEKLIFNMKIAIVLAREDGINGIIHHDVHVLLHMSDTSIAGEPMVLSSRKIGNPAEILNNDSVSSFQSMLSVLSNRTFMLGMARRSVCEIIRIIMVFFLRKAGKMIPEDGKVWTCKYIHMLFDPGGRKMGYSMSLKLRRPYISPFLRTRMFLTGGYCHDPATR